MSDYGIKILNIAAASIYEVNIGVRDVLDSKDAMLTNSLFLDYMLEHGLEIWKGESTRSIISISFQYGSRTYEQESEHLQNLLETSNNKERTKRIQWLIKNAEENKDKFDRKTKDELRTMFYRDGVDVTYNSKTKAGEIVKSETRHYKMLYRTPGKAKKGDCIFAEDKIFDTARRFLYMGITLPKHNAPIVEIGAYSSLVTSSIVGRIRIEPENVLIMDDVVVPFRRDVVSIETNSRNECIAVHRDNYELSNEMFDGQSLIDSEIFPSWADGYILLRQHMTKCAAFCTHIQKYFRDYCAEYGIDYETFTIPDKWGNMHLAKEIKLITTTNATKWIKFGITYEEWSKWVNENGGYFGVVKTAHQSKLGEVQTMSYQMINTLGVEMIHAVMQPTADYIYKLQTDDEEFLHYLNMNQNFSNDFDVLIALVRHNPKFVRSEYFKDRRSRIIQGYIVNMKTGKLIQNADNLVIVGSPMAMLMHAVGLSALNDPTFEYEEDTIQCYTERFDNGEYLASFRSPHNSCNNIGYLHNHYHEYFKKYFEFGKQILAINMNGTDFQDRHNGSDQDSDSCYVTNHPDIAQHARYCYEHYPTIVNNIPKESKTYDNTLENYAAIDNRLSASQRDIGQSSNLAAICLSYEYTNHSQDYLDYICILSVLAQAAIDSSKRTYVVDIAAEIKRIRANMHINENGYPQFWKNIHPEFKGFINDELRCPMNEVARFKAKRPRHNPHPIPNQEFFNRYQQFAKRRYRSKKVEDLIKKYSIKLFEYNCSDEKEYEEYILLREDFDELVSDIKQTYISNNYLGLMSWLIDRALLITPDVARTHKQMQSALYKNRSLLLKVLYNVSPTQFLQCFKRSFEPYSE